LTERNAPDADVDHARASMVRDLSRGSLTVNSLFGTDYGQLQAKPAHPSLLEYMARWPYHVAELALLAVLSCLIYYTPFFILERVRPK